ncbi:hypothetical protein [Chitinophaga nivalis]|uniref:Uncharacterized protein n=1 Tax=Chitinophaga nivalis TaxID=2991709 RepID=A0ABT3IJ70_9BACT|nr:hypothetical protein [Chitinophaga nivalis]MCW3466302.1 hypothetical protein [Chitinophaga nivalis]MCW3484007.1 hypothetical protein [Chitinophaga nivalis]
MKRLVSIWLLCIVFIQSTSNCWIVASFYLSRQYIARTLCLDRFQLEPDCGGDCYLEIKITENQHKQESSTDLKIRESIPFFSPQLTVFAAGEPVAAPTVYAIYIPPYHPLRYSPGIFKPPAFTA